MDQIAMRDVFEAAADVGAPVSFVYRSSEGTRERRQLELEENPVRTAAAGHDFVIGSDLARGEPRSFRLDRIEGDVEVGV